MKMSMLFLMNARPRKKISKNFEKGIAFLFSLCYNTLRQQKYSSIAQSVEHAAVNRRVVGSSPT